MKTSLKVLAAIGALGLVILLGLHLFLQFGLTRTMREVVLPRIKAETGIDVRVGGLSINLPRGVLHLNEVEVRNPDGFLLENLASIDRVRLEIDLFSLLRQAPILVESIEVENARLNVVRNQDGEINLERLQASGPLPSVPPPSLQPVREQAPVPAEAPAEVRSAAARPLPEVLIKGLSCDAQVRYLDFRLNQLDIVLDLGVNGSGLSTQRDPSQPWGQLAIIGALGSNRSRFITDIGIRLAPLTDPAAPSFDLTGKVMEIDPRIMEKAYSKLGIRSAPFGLDPELHCREGRFENSVVGLNLNNIEFEEKLTKRLGGMASIRSLRFPVPVEGTLQDPHADLQAALLAAVGGNTRTLVDAFLKGAAAREAGLQDTPESLADAAVEAVGSQVKEVGENEAAMQAMKSLVGGTPAATNASPVVSSDVLIDILGEEVEEIGGNEELKKDLKNLGKWLFGK